MKGQVGVEVALEAARGGDFCVGRCEGRVRKSLRVWESTGRAGEGENALNSFEMAALERSEYIGQPPL